MNDPVDAVFSYQAHVRLLVSHIASTYHNAIGDIGDKARVTSSRRNDDVGASRDQLTCYMRSNHSRATSN
jgi:hypothetical protein